MKNDYNHILQELREICPFIAEINKTNVYSVSSTYFNNLSVEIEERINFIKERAYNLPAAAHFSIPENYFENLSDVILQKVATTHKRLNEVIMELERIAPLLNTIDKNPVYSIPDDFFNSVKIPFGRIKEKKAKIISINNWPRLLKFSAAAVITSFLAIGLYTITGKDFITRETNHAKNAVKNLSREEIVNYLKNHSSSENVTSVTRRSKNANAIKSSLKKLSAKEIQQFLKETGESDEI